MWHMSAMKDETREDRIIMEIVVDAYGPEERAMGWYCYLENTLAFGFTAHCIRTRATSPSSRPHTKHWRRGACLAAIPSSGRISLQGAV